MDIELKNKLGQLFVFGFEGTKVSKNIKKLIEEYRIGNIILFSRNYESDSQIKKLMDELQDIARKAGHEYPLSIMIDQENGTVNRIGKTSDLPGSMLIGASHNTQNAYKVAKLTAQKLRSLGINWNLAPVVDINNNPLNPVIGIRSYGDNSELVSQFGVEFARGLNSENVIATMKHFPGHGDTSIDSHLDLPVINHEINRLRDVELVPFKNGIKNNIDSIMIAHIYFPELEKQVNVPASLSKTIINGLLREDLGYDGVVVTDCLEMKAISDGVGTAVGALRALQAGADIAMVSHTYDIQVKTMENVYQAIADGELSEDRIEESFNRVTQLKNKRLINNTVSTSTKLNTDQIFQDGITKIKNYQISQESKTLFILVNENISNFAEEKQTIIDFEKIQNQISFEGNFFELNNQNIEDIEKKINNYDEIVFILFNHSKDEMINQFIQQTILKKNTSILGIKSPYIIHSYAAAAQIVLTYQPTPLAILYGIKALFGILEAKGELPFDINFKIGE